MVNILGADNKLVKLRQEKICINLRQRIKNKYPSIISSNCVGSFISKDLGLKYNTPTVNLYMEPKDFIRYLSNMNYYNESELKFDVEGVPRPIGFLNDVKIHFLHYSSSEEAKSKWNERKIRINPYNIFIIMSERDGCTYEDLKNFDQLPYRNKIVFTHKPYPGIASSYYIKGFEQDNECGVVLNFCELDGQRFYDQFDFISWLNGMPLTELKRNSNR